MSQLNFNVGRDRMCCIAGLKNTVRLFTPRVGVSALAVMSEILASQTLSLSALSKAMEDQVDPPSAERATALRNGMCAGVCV